MQKKYLIIVFSYHHNNTAKIANEFAKVLDADIKAPSELNSESLMDYELIGFGAGIDSGKQYKPLLDFADKITKVNNKEAYIFSTSAVQWKYKVYDDHTALRDKLKSKGYIVVGEFSCKGFNTNSFLKYLEGMNKGKPDSKDLQDSQDFAFNLKKRKVAEK